MPVIRNSRFTRVYDLHDPKDLFVATQHLQDIHLYSYSDKKSIWYTWMLWIITHKKARYYHIVKKYEESRLSIWIDNTP